MSALTNVVDRAISAEVDLSDQQSQMLFTRKQYPDVIVIHRSSCCSLNPCVNFHRNSYSLLASDHQSHCKKLCDDWENKENKKCTSNWKKVQRFARNYVWNIEKSATKKYGVPKSTVSTWLANKDIILGAYEPGDINPKRQKMKRVENKDFDKAVYTWFHNTRANTGVVLKEKVLQFAKSLHLDDFRASDCWLDKWKCRHNVISGETFGEEKSCTPEMTASWKETHLPTILSRY